MADRHGQLRGDVDVVIMRGGTSKGAFVRMADTPERLNQVRIDVQQADAILAGDIVVGASPEALQAVRRDRTRVLANVHQIPVAELQKKAA